MFEILDLPAERRLRHVEPPRRAAEMQLFRHRDEATNLVEIKHRSTLRNDLARLIP